MLFRYGAVRILRRQSRVRGGRLAEIQPQIGNPYPAPETEEVEVRVDPAVKQGMKEEVVFLEAVSVERLQVIADVLSKSVLLAFYESGIAAGLERMERLAVELERTGRIAAKTPSLLKDVGASLHTEHLMVGRAAVSDKPEILVGRAGAGGSDLRLEDEFELQERHLALEQKLGLVTRTAQTLLDTLNTPAFAARGVVYRDPDRGGRSGSRCHELFPARALIRGSAGRHPARGAANHLHYLEQLGRPHPAGDAHGEMRVFVRDTVPHVLQGTR